MEDGRWRGSTADLEAYIPAARKLLDPGPRLRPGILEARLAAIAAEGPPGQLPIRPWHRRSRQTV